MYPAELSLQMLALVIRRGLKREIYIGLGDIVVLSHDFSE